MNRWSDVSRTTRILSARVALASLMLAVSGAGIAGPNDGLAPGAEPDGTGSSGPIVPGAGWSATTNVPPAFFWGEGEPVFALDGPFTFDGNFCVFVTDDFQAGDQFRIYDNGEVVGDTSAVPEDDGTSEVGPDAAYADPAYSSGLFPVGGGSHSITIEVINNPFGGGRGYIKVEECPLGVGEPLARFQVEKFFNDGNPAEVDVMITCNTGLPLEQPATISQGDGVTFVVGDFEDGAMNCEVVETAGADGYSVSYLADGSVNSEDGCSFEGIRFGDIRTCRIDNTLDQVEVEVTKEWIDENPQFAATNLAEANWSCTNVAQGSSYGWLEFFGTTDTRSFFVYPDWEFGTDCDITEVEIADGGVEVDDSDCQNIELFPGDSASCTIVNTRLYEGIPTLSQYGLAVLALMMLGMGFVAYRRLI